MLTEIKLNGYASFKHETCLQTDKPINFVYGLNGTGKSSLTRYLAHRDDPKYAQCSITPAIDPDKEVILVYNQDYISETFVDKDRQNGVFTLSKQNKKAYDAIQKATQKLAELDVQDKAIEEAQKKKPSTTRRCRTIGICVRRLRLGATVSRFISAVSACMEASVSKSFITIQMQEYHTVYLFVSSRILFLRKSTSTRCFDGPSTARVASRY